MHSVLKLGTGTDSVSVIYALNHVHTLENQSITTTRVIVCALTVEAGSGRDGDPDNAEIIFQVKQRVARGHDFTLQYFSKGYSGMRTEV